MAEYTPTTDDIREDWVCDAPTPEMRAEAVATFDRWLAEVRREAAEKAWDAGWDARHHYDERGGEPAPSNPHTKETT